MVFQELDSQNIRVDAFRRNLQRGYIELPSEKLNGRGAVTDDARPLIRGELRGIGAQIAQVLPRVNDRETKLHLEDLRDQTAKALDPKFQPSAPAANLPARFPSAEDTCWPDYAIR